LIGVHSVAIILEFTWVDVSITNNFMEIPHMIVTTISACETPRTKATDV